MRFRIGKLAGGMALSALLVLGPISLAAAENDGETIYKAKCAACHGVDGKAQTKPGQSLHAPDFHSPEVEQKTDAALAGVIANGKNYMPKFGEKLTNKEISGVVGYVRALAKSH